MDYYVTDDATTIDFLANVLLRASENGQRIRIRTDSNNTLQIKRGEGAWSGPFSSGPDPYRDTSKPAPTCTVGCDKAACRSTREGEGSYVNGVWTTF